VLVRATKDTSLQFEDYYGFVRGRYYEQFAILVVDKDGNEMSDVSRVTIDSQCKQTNKH